MITFKRLINPSFLYLLGLVLSTTLFLNSCGGGAAAFAGVGSGGTGVVVQGLVTGFGSIFVDGTEYPLSTSASVKEQFDGNSSTGLLSLGQIVTVTLDSSNTVISAQISPDLQGVVTYKPAAFTTTANGTCPATSDYYVYVLNQKVRIVTQACNTPLGITTIFNEPFVQCASNNTCSTGTTSGLPSYIGSLVSGSEVKVHGFWVVNQTTNKPELIATRIDQYYVPSNNAVYYNNPLGVNQAASVYELSGIVTGISSNTLAINGGNNTSGVTGGSSVVATSLPNSLSINQIVSMNVATSDWTNYFGSNYDNNAYTPNSLLTVSNVVIDSATSFSSSANPVVQVSGIITYINGNVAVINGTQVNLPSGCTNCQVGDYISVKGTNTNSQGELEGSNLEFSHASNEINSSSNVNLKGIIVFPALNGDGSTTVVFQGVATYLSSQTLSNSGCSSGSTQYVQVSASYTNGQLIGKSVTCTNVSTATAQNVFADYVGTSTDFSRNNNQFHFSSNGLNYIVTYNSNTYIESDLLSGTSNIEVIGVIGTLPSGSNPGTITATSLKKTDSSTQLKTESD